MKTRALFVAVALLAALLPSLAGADGPPPDGTWHYRYLIVPSANRYNVPPGLVQAIMSVESGGDPGSYSSSGAIGLMQVEGFWFRGGQDPWDWATNIDVGTSIIAGCEQAAYGGWRPLPDPAGTWQAAIGCYLTGHPTTDPEWYIDRVTNAWIEIAANGG